MTSIAIFGISGHLGQALASAARDRHWAVRGFGRIASATPLGAAMVRGSYADAPRVAEALTGTDAVCCVYGPRRPYTDAFCAAATAAVIAAARARGVTRLLCVTGAMIGDLTGRSRPMTWAARRFQARRPAVAADREAQETLVMQSALAWTVLKPPRLTSGPETGNIVAGPDLAVGLLSSLSRADLAAFMLDAIARDQHVGARLVVRARRRLGLREEHHE